MAGPSATPPVPGPEHPGTRRPGPAQEGPRARSAPHVMWPQAMPVARISAGLAHRVSRSPVGLTGAIETWLHLWAGLARGGGSHPQPCGLPLLQSACPGKSSGSGISCFPEIAMKTSGWVISCRKQKLPTPALMQKASELLHLVAQGAPGGPTPQAQPKGPPAPGPSSCTPLSHTPALWAVLGESLAGNLGSGASPRW